MWLFRGKNKSVAAEEEEEARVARDIAALDNADSEQGQQQDADDVDEINVDAMQVAEEAATAHIATQAELAALAEMKAKLAIGESEQNRPGQALDVALDWTLIRFLRARKLDVAAAIEQYLTMLEWRRENNVDGMLGRPDPCERVFQCVCPHRHHGFDRQGHPVYYEMTGAIRVGEMLKHMEEPDIVMRHVRFMEHVIQRMIKQSLDTGRYVGQCVMIHDMAGMKYSIETAGMRCFRRTTHIDQQFYPECLNRILIINAPLSFRGTWMVVRPWLDEKTRKKVEILGGNFHQRLSELIPPEHLPRMYGGDSVFEGVDPAGPAASSAPPVLPVTCADSEVPATWPMIERGKVDLEGGEDRSPAAVAPS